MDETVSESMVERDLEDGLDFLGQRLGLRRKHRRQLGQLARSLPVAPDQPVVWVAVSETRLDSAFSGDPESEPSWGSPHPALVICLPDRVVVGYTQGGPIETGNQPIPLDSIRRLNTGTADDEPLVIMCTGQSRWLFVLEGTQRESAFLHYALCGAIVHTPTGIRVVSEKLYNTREESPS